MSFYFGFQRFDNLLSCVEVGVTQDVQQTFIAKLMQFGIFGLAQPVGIYKERASFYAIYLFAYILQIGP